MRLTILFLALAAVMLAQPAAAQTCNFSNTGIDFGNVLLASGSFQLSTGTFTANCSGTPGQTIRICPNFNAGSGGMNVSGDPRYLAQGATRMDFNIFKSNGVGQVWGSYTWSAAARPPVLTISLPASGSGSGSQTMFGRLYNKQGVLPTGTYSSVFSGVNTQIDYGYAPGFNCGPALSSRVQNVPFVVRTTNNSSCILATTELNFGSQVSLGSQILSSNSLQVTCTAGTVYEVSLNNGTSGATSPTTRRMTNATTSSSITYGIYRDTGRTQPWGSTSGSNTVSSVGTGSAQTFTGYGKVPAQATPPSLNYADTIIIQVTY